MASTSSDQDPFIIFDNIDLMAQGVWSPEDTKHTRSVYDTRSVRLSLH